MNIYNMKHKRFLPCFLFWLCCLSGPVSAGGFKLESPDKNITVQVSIGTRISYTVQYKNEAVMAPSFVLLSLDSNRVLGLNPKLLTDRITGVSTRVRTYAYKRDELNNTYTELTLTFQGNYGMYFRAYNGGVAYRFFTRFKHPVKVLHEEAAFNFPRNGVVYSTCTPDTSFIGTFESLYRTDSLSAFGPASMAFLPVLVCPKPEKTPLKVLITEADLFSYPGMYLKKGADNSLKAVFPKVPANIDYESTTNGGHKIKTPVAREPWLAATTGERSYPWRVLIISDNDAALADNDMVYNLSRPNKLTDLSWLKPGIAVSEEWNNADLTGIDFRAGHNTDTYKHFIDFAAKNKLPYFRIAEGWAKNPDNTDEPASEVNLSEVTEYARKKNVGIILCCNAFAFRNTMQASLQKLAKTGIKGLNIAGIYRDDQQMNDFLEQLTAEAAAVKLFVTFSECAKPAGFSRTYPNE